MRAAALAASVTGSRLAPMTVVWPPAESCLIALLSLMRPASGLLPAPSANKSLQRSNKPQQIDCQLRLVGQATNYTGYNSMRSTRLLARQATTDTGYNSMQSTRLFAPG